MENKNEKSWVQARNGSRLVKLMYEA
jgi:hypothetical protein